MKKIFLLTAITFFLYGSPFSQTYIAGETYFGNNNYIEYRAGNLPIVISAPHGGSLTPVQIPNRNCSGCVYVTDSFTEDLIRQMNEAIYDLFGCYPHVIINRLKRTKLDANRDIGDAADGNILAEEAWHDFHDFIQAAKDTIIANYGKGLYLDLHGHGHQNQRLELGYRVSKSELQLSDATLNQIQYVNDASIKNLVNDNLNDFNLSIIIRGGDSFGELYEQEGFPAVPSQTQPFPFSNESYFNGGYNTERHGSKLGGSIDGIQIECNMEGVRDTYGNRESFAESTALVLKKYLEQHYFGADFTNLNCGLMTSAAETNTQEAIGIYLAPNPVDDYLSVELFLPFSDSFSVTVFNDLGQVLFQNNYMDTNFIKIPTRSFQGGMYFLKVQSQGFVQIKKFTCTR